MRHSYGCWRGKFPAGWHFESNCINWNVKLSYNIQKNDADCHLILHFLWSFSIFYLTAFDFNVTLPFVFISILIKLISGNSRKLSSNKNHHRLLSAQQQTADRYRCIQQRKRDVSLLVETKTEPEGEWIWMLKVGNACVYICKVAATQNWRLLNDPSSHQSSVVSCLWSQTSFILYFLGGKLCPSLHVLVPHPEPELFAPRRCNSVSSIFKKCRPLSDCSSEAVHFLKPVTESLKMQRTIHAITKQGAPHATSLQVLITFITGE